MKRSCDCIIAEIPARGMRKCMIYARKTRWSYGAELCNKVKSYWHFILG